MKGSWLEVILVLLFLFSLVSYNILYVKARNWIIFIDIIFSSVIGVYITLVPWFNSVF